jgi:hypothetical protein
MRACGLGDDMFIVRWLLFMTMSAPPSVSSSLSRSLLPRICCYILLVIQSQSSYAASFFIKFTFKRSDPPFHPHKPAPPPLAFTSAARSSKSMLYRNYTEYQLSAPVHFPAISRFL